MTINKELKKYLDSFPNKATSWRDATDDIREVAKLAREIYNEFEDEQIEALNFKNIKTPSQWNTFAKKYIIMAWSKMKDETKSHFMREFKENFLNENVKNIDEDFKYPTNLKVGSIFQGVGFPMMKGIDGGKFYYITNVDNYSATFVQTNEKGTKFGKKKFRHTFDNLEGGIKTVSRGDENGIKVIKEELQYKGKSAEQIKTNMPGFIGSDFAKKASDEDIIEMTKLMDEKSIAYNTHIFPIVQKVHKLRAKYKLKKADWL